MHRKTGKENNNGQKRPFVQVPTDQNKSGEKRGKNQHQATNRDMKRKSKKT